MANCPNEQYGNVGTHTCDDCATGCATCFGGSDTQCTVCKLDSNQYYLDLGTTNCVQTCTPGTWGQASDSKCYACDASCLTCNGGLATNCQTCGNKTGILLFLNGTMCVAVCPAS